MHSTTAVQQRTKSLTEEQVARYRRDGAVWPIRVISPDEARTLRRKLEDFERANGGPISGSLRHKPHLIFTWLNDLIRHRAILDAVEDVLGPDILCWSSSFFTKEARDPAFVSWHQDSTYWGLSEPEVMTAWVAFTVSNHANGCMRFIPASHTRDQVPHKDTFAQNNLLTRGQEISVEVDQNDAVEIELQPGEMSLHHVRLFHSSEPNRSDDRRIGYAIRYIPTRIKQITAIPDSASLVRGVDRYHHFEPEPRPAYDLAPEALKYQADINKRAFQILYRDAEKKPY